MTAACKAIAGATASVRVNAHILVVEDEPLAAATLSTYLARKGYRVSVAHSGSDALKMHRADPADLIITDWLMPQGNGLALVAELNAENPRIPVIITSGWPEGLPSKGGEGQVTLKKPLDLRQVLTSVERLLANPE